VQRCCFCSSAGGVTPSLGLVVCL